ncbi:MAG: hypothetical protein ACU0GG_10915 [Paracoccaceae bacterium]
MNLKIVRPRIDVPVERLSSDSESLRKALEDALARIEKLEEEVARLRGELPPEEDAE